MHTKELLPILREFKGKKSFIKLLNGDMISGTVGEIEIGGEASEQKEKPSVIILDAGNMKMAVCLSRISALRLA